MKRIILGLLASVLGIVAFVTPAQAAVVKVDPVKVSVDSRFESFRTVVETNASAERYHMASIWVGYPNGFRHTYVGSGVSRGRLVPVKAELDTLSIGGNWGRQDAIAFDDVDGKGKVMSLDVRRRTQIFTDYAYAGRGAVAIAATVTHYSPADRSYVGSKLSPVWVQELRPSGWTTVKSLTTDSFGAANGSFPAKRGDHRYRLFRPNGRTVWAAAAQSVVLRVK